MLMAHKWQSYECKAWLLLLMATIVMLTCASCKSSYAYTRPTDPTEEPRYPSAMATLEPQVENARLIAQLKSQPLEFTESRPRFCWSADGKRLAYLDNEQLAIVQAPDFSQPQTLAQVGRSSDTTCSPMGSDVALVQARQDPTVLVETIIVVGQDGAIRDLLPGKKADMSVSNAKKLLTWSDDRWIFFTDHVGTGANSLAAVHADTGEVQNIVNYPNGVVSDVVGAVYDWSPTRAFLAMEEATSGAAKITIAEMSTRRIVRLYEQPGMPQFQMLESWSPNPGEQKLLFEGWSGDFMGFPSALPDLMTWDARKATRQRWVPHACRALWSPDGTRLAFFLIGEPIYDAQGRLIDTSVAVTSTAYLKLGILDVATNLVMELTPILPVRDQGPYRDPHCFTNNILAWSPDGSKLVYSTGEGELWLYLVDRKERRQLLSRSEGGQAVWSPDGTKIAISTPRNILLLEPN